MPTLELVFAKSKLFADKDICVLCECTDPALPRPENSIPGQSFGWEGRSPSEMIAKAVALGWSGYRSAIDPVQARQYEDRYLFSVYFDVYEPRPSS